MTGPRLVVSLVGIMAVAVAASRLLGARRSVAAVVVSGLAGWLMGETLAVVLARNHEHGSAGFTRDLWLFSAFFTMSATVWIEMLAKPGGLVHTQSLLSSVPRPLKALRRRSARVGRYLQITRIVARNGLGLSIRLDETGNDLDDSLTASVAAEVRLRRALEEAGGMFVKLGQVMSTRSDLLPPAMVVPTRRSTPGTPRRGRPPSPRTARPTSARSRCAGRCGRCPGDAKISEQRALRSPPCPMC